MRALDGFCGRGGWTRGLIEAGFECDGFDLDPQPDYPGRFLQADARTFHPEPETYDVVVMSPPCQGFSFMNRQVQEGKRPNPLDLELVAHALRIIGEARPRFWAVENVQGALTWFRPLAGEPRLRNPPWYVWGDFPPFIVGQDRMKKMPASRGGAKAWHNMGKRQRAALTAEIPAGLSRPFAQACKEAMLVG
jgi:hypothetical protein